MISEDEKLHVTRVGRDGRRWYDPSWKARLVSSSFEQGVSVSRLALDHGINANLLRKWIKSFQESDLAPLPASSAFIPVHVTGAGQSPARVSSGLDMRGQRGQEKPLRSEGMGTLCSSAKVSAVLPNGVKLTLECGDGRALTTIIGALGDVQTAH
jgi:transposase